MPRAKGGKNKLKVVTADCTGAPNMSQIPNMKSPFILC